MRRYLPFAALMVMASPAVAQTVPEAPEGLDVSASVRLRYEVIQDQARANVPVDETSTQLRTILRATYRTGRVTFGGGLYDSRALDAANPTALTNNDVNAMEPLEAWVAVDLGTPGDDRVSGRLQLGRTYLNLGSRRLVASDDYRNTMNGYTGLRLDLTGPAKTEATIIYVLPQQRLPNDEAGVRDNRIVFDHEGFDQRLWGLRTAKADVVSHTTIEASFYRFEERDTPSMATRDRHLSNIDLRVYADQHPGRFDYEFEVIRQTGSISTSLAPDAPRQPVEAWFAHGEVGYQWAGGWQPHLVMESDYASGDDRGPTYHRFDTLFGMRRSDYGPVGLYAAVTRDNLIAVGPRLEVTPNRRVDAFMTVKKLWLASAVDSFSTTGVVDPTGDSGTNAGWQTDARVRYWAVPKRLQLEVDGAWLAKGRFLATAPNSVSSGDTLYLSFNATVFL